MRFDSLQLDRDSPRPLFEQLADQCRRRIRTGEWRNGTPLLAVREAARVLRVSAETVQRAYRLLREEGWIVSRPGSGTVVAHSSTFTPQPAVAPAKEPKSALLAHRLHDWARLPEGLFVSAGPAEPDRGLLRALREAASAAVDDALRESFSDILGLPDLRSMAQGWLASRGWYVSLDRIVVVSGAQQGIVLAADLAIRPGSVVFMPEMGYRPAREVFESRGATVRTLAVRPEGTDFDPLERALETEDVSLVYAMPAGHYPSGWSWPRSQRQHLQRLAARTGLAVLEDDYNAVWNYSGTPPTAVSAGEGVRSYYLLSFGSLVHPSLRIGLFVVPEEDCFEAERLKFLSDVAANPVAQHLLNRVWRSGALEQYWNRRRERLAAAREAAVASCRRWLPEDCGVSPPDAGASLFIKTPERLDMSFVDACARNGARVVPGLAFGGEEASRGFLVRFGGVPEGELDEGIRRVGQTLRELRRASL